MLIIFMYMVFLFEIKKYMEFKLIALCFNFTVVSLIGFLCLRITYKYL